MENDRGRRHNSRSSFSSKQKTGGAKIPQINQEDASFLIGNIIEKGMRGDEPFIKPKPLAAPPQPTVFPFPVARHRSHGPHWGPNAITKNDGSGDIYAVVDDGEEENPAEFEPATGVFAKPVQKKEGKNLDLSRWRELCSTDISLAPFRKEEHKYLSSEFDERNKEGKEAEFMETENASRSLTPVSGDTPSGRHLDMDEDPRAPFRELPMKAEEGISTRGVSNLLAETMAEPSLKFEDEPASKKMQKTQQQTSTDKQTGSMLHVSSIRSKSFESELKSQIDAENLARLQGMSPDEITGVQAEIMEKIDPALLKMLQKRSQDKLKKQESPSSDLVIMSKSDDAQSKNQFTGFQKDFPQFLHGVNTTTAAPKDTKKTPDDSGKNVISANNSLWKAWSERVEAVRRLRFSFDGSVIENGLVEFPETGIVSGDSGYSADNVTERDFLRTEGDPGAAGYTIKEAVSLMRSVVPGQRALALHLLAAVLDKALFNIHENQVETASFIDWEAVWAFSLGPEPELILALRMALDDNHTSVVLTCAKALQCILSCERNEDYFNIFEKLAPYGKVVCTAPVFRARPETDAGFLHGGFWKYSAKPSNILPFKEGAMDDEAEGKRTIQDDVFVSGQDIVAGLVRMGLLPRICYLLEADPAAALEECIISILIAVARHSPTCADEIKKCPRLVHTVVSRFIMKNKMEIYPSMIKSVILLKVLAQYDRKSCFEFIENGMFQDMTWHLYRNVLSLEHWQRTGRENCKLSSALMVEQLRLWKACIHFGYCVSYFEIFFPGLCLWLHPPTLETLIHHNLLGEFAAVSTEAFLLLGALGKTLPNFYSLKDRNNQTSELVWSWSQAGLMTDLALKWIVAMSKFFQQNKETNGESAMHVLWVFSSAMHLISCVLQRAIPENTDRVPWLPEFVPKVGLELIKNGLLSFIAELCYLRCQGDHQTSLASVCCLHGLLQVFTFIDRLIKLAKSEVPPLSPSAHSSSREAKILEDGVLNMSLDELRSLLITFTKLINSEWRHVQGIEIYGRGGLAPGVGLGWGSSGGGFWSKINLVAQLDARLLILLLEISQLVTSKHLSDVDELRFNMERINSVLCACLTLGPSDHMAMDRAFGILFQAPVFKQLDQFSHKFSWDFAEEDYLSFCKILGSHFRNRWLGVKWKKNFSSEPFKRVGGSLETIHEDADMSDTNFPNHYESSLVVQWAHQRLPLPLHWFLSPISSEIPNNEVVKSGLFFFLGIEGICSYISADAHSPVHQVPLVWKIHSLSVIFLAGMAVLEEEKSRDVYEVLQEVHGQSLDKQRHGRGSFEVNGRKERVELLRFKSEIHESYPTFIETVVEEFAAVSYGNQLFGRQIAFYLHGCAEAEVRLTVWNALSNAHALELLPPLEKCLGEGDGYLEPVEDNELVLEAYVKSWVSGALDRAMARGSVTFTLALHHLSSFIFLYGANDSPVLRNKLVKFLVRDYSCKPQQREGMMLDLIRYHGQSGSGDPEPEVGVVMEKRFELLMDACEGNSSLLREIEKLRSSFRENKLCGAGV